MPYDSTKPANNSPISSAELRSQFAGLKEEIEQRVIYADLYDGINNSSAGPVNDVAPLNLAVSNPPTQLEVQLIAERFDTLLAALKRQ